MKSRDEIVDIPDSLSMIFSHNKYSYVEYICKSRCAGHINNYVFEVRIYI